MIKFTIDNKTLESDNLIKKEFFISSHPKPYAVKFQKFQSKLDSKDVLLIDKNVHELYPIRHEKTIIIEAKEENKCVDTAMQIYEKMLYYDFNKGNRMVVVGGGIIQDLGAFTSKTFKRGVDWVLYPTTLLSQCDSSIGGKTALNFKTFKNQVGLFSAPSEVIIDTNFLKTLSKEDIISGYGEIAKLFAIGGNYYLNLLDNSSIEDLIYHSLSIKKSIIEFDEFENSERRSLNFGHSFGHVIETLTNYKIPHGEAVLLGMEIINKLFDNNKNITDLINRYTSLQKIKNIDIEKLVNGLKTDKKTFNDGIIFVRVPEPGNTIFSNTKIDNHLVGKVYELFAN